MLAPASPDRQTPSQSGLTAETPSTPFGDTKRSLFPSPGKTPAGKVDDRFFFDAREVMKRTAPFHMNPKVYEPLAPQIKSGEYAHYMDAMYRGKQQSTASRSRTATSRFDDSFPRGVDFDWAHQAPHNARPDHGRRGGLDVHEALWGSPSQKLTGSSLYKSLYEK